MSWPLASHFSAILQNPRLAFRDAALQSCRIETDARRQPRPWAGAFAVVYKATAADTGHAFAIRVFTTESPERRERYDLISDYLKDRRPSCLVDFEYRDRSIRSAGDGKWYPLILMDWVEGETLFSWARTRCLAADGAALAQAAQRWLHLVQDLERAEVAHGDLQHANVMVTPSGELKLVDYDGMCVPALAGRQNLEIGVEPYQHPHRNELTRLSADLDHYSSLVIYVALRALSAAPRLWIRYVEEPQYDKLLFRKEDLQSPATSPLCRELLESPDAQVGELARHLFQLWQAPIDEVPPLGRLVDSYDKIEALLRAEQWEAAVKLLNRRGQFRDAPSRLKPLIQQAYEHHCRQEALVALQRIVVQETEASDRALAAAWNEELLAGYAPAAPLRRRVALARKRLKVLEQLAQLLAEMGPGKRREVLEKERQLVATVRRFPARYDYRLKSRVELARTRVRCVRQVEAAIGSASSEQAIVEAWQQATEAGCEPLIARRHQARIAVAQKRLPLLEALKGLDTGLPRDEHDHCLLDLWQESLLDQCPAADPWREAYQAAIHRRNVMARLQAAVDAHQDEEIDRLVQDASLVEYPLPAAWTPAIAAARKRSAEIGQFLEALSGGDPSRLTSLFDARVIRRHPQSFARYERVLNDWIESELLATERLGLGPAVARGSLVCIDSRARTWRLRWSWPQPRFTDQCIVAVLAGAPRPNEDPREIAVLDRFLVDRSSWEEGGGSRLLHAQPQWEGAVVAVWALVDAGFRAFVSRPLVLGRLHHARRRQDQRREGIPSRPISLSQDAAPGLGGRQG